MSTSETGQTIGIDEATMRGDASGEPSLALPNTYIETYREGLKKAGVSEEDIERQVTCLTDQIARDSRPEREHTVEVEKVTQSEGFDRVNSIVTAGRGLIKPVVHGPRERHVFKHISRLLIATESARIANKEAVRTVSDPLKNARSAIEGLATATHIQIFPLESSPVPVDTQPTIQVRTKTR